ncbi:hypothetical protein AB4347_02040 [Vibrio breoganii]|uniref:hypothetical protein n=1 Tax=Vibrio TaxID=662 RepID=UPI000C8322AB|nr:hypothetical protein [Vibrio breoganii]PMG94197.1 hypothetical protein BCU80_07115 [Vibrio breoganii]PMK23236.1 hypothetical protein BCU06_04290 [Vibrio breoganii]PMK55652.1 hypothetical protein BCT98_10280 [Vibrio breoganii]PMK67133.1 hypothetical protein BCT94_17615 [Vibrio breoganii]PML25780.1 hypothetical protein BCT82_11190 [Vibrio breoganii]
MSRDTKELFKELSEKKMEKMHAEELQTLSIRLTPEVGIMLKTLSHDNVLNFPVSTSFREMISHALHDILIEKACGEEDLTKFNDFLTTISKREDLIEDAHITNALYLIKNSEYLEYENVFKDFFV